MSVFTFSPSREDFIRDANAGKAQVIFTKRVSDLETPVSAMLKLPDDAPAFLLESVEGGESRGRYSIIGIDPDLMWRCYGNRSEISTTPPFAESSFESAWDDSMSTLRRLVHEHRMDLPEGTPPMAAGLIGYMGYDMVKLMERLPDTKPDPLKIPDACFIRPRVQLIFDGVDGVVYILAPVWKTESDAGKIYDTTCARLEKIARQLQGPLDQRNYYKDVPAIPRAFRSNMREDEHAAMIKKAKEYMAAGDIFQVVLGQRFTADFDLPPLALYRALRHMNPSPFLFYLNFGDYALVGSSPEILVRLRDDTVTIRPIAGTRKRGKTKAEDAALAADLLADPKELAEHLMLLDLGRNDVGRVAKAGDVRVTERMTIEHYSHVMHIVSNVEGTIDPKYDAVDALIAGFPAGTVSGAPKIRAMEIIDELEPVKRSYYGGCVGYFSANGTMDTCITLRTALVKGGKIHVQAGGGIVADSVAADEYQESLNKAKAVMRAAEEAVKFA
ncbi:MAG: anthranilate synthase component I [Alphaproteobacteria bacterium]|nr:anthranilate synthase component I [Alphaproteobacteria bacterium]